MSPLHRTLAVAVISVAIMGIFGSLSPRMKERQPAAGRSAPGIPSIARSQPPPISRVEDPFKEWRAANRQGEQAGKAIERGDEDLGVARRRLGMAKDFSDSRAAGRGEERAKAILKWEADVSLSTSQRRERVAQAIRERASSALVATPVLPVASAQTSAGRASPAVGARARPKVAAGAAVGRVAVVGESERWAAAWAIFSLLGLGASSWGWAAFWRRKGKAARQAIPSVSLDPSARSRI